MRSKFPYRNYDDTAAAAYRTIVEALDPSINDVVLDAAAPPTRWAYADHRRDRGQAFLTWAGITGLAAAA
jgi:hypothetical protein